MPSNLIPYAVCWAVLVVIVLCLATYKAALALRARREELPHICSMENSQASKLTSVVNLETTIERWGEILTVLALVYGLALAGIYAYHLLYGPQTLIL